MAGLLGLVTSFAERRLHLGYRRARLLAPMGGMPAGAMLNGHEFHYSAIVEQPDSPLAHVTDAEGDRTSVVSGKSVSVSVDLGGRRIINKKKKTINPSGPTCNSTH